MASKRKLKLRRVSAAHLAVLQTVHDRKSQDLTINARVAPITIDDPYGSETGAKIVAFRSLRDDPIAAMHDRGTVDEAQYQAARHWQRLHELVEVGGARAIDPTKEAVDGGQIPEPMSEAQRKAAGELARVGRVLGQEGEAIIRDVLGDRMVLIHAATKRGLTTERELFYIGRRFKESLDTLAVEFGYAMRRRG